MKIAFALALVLAVAFAGMFLLLLHDLLLLDCRGSA
jgi:hypothetical protein